MSDMEADDGGERIFNVSVEGNIGSGKSTFLSALAEGKDSVLGIGIGGANACFPDFQIYPEPVGQWCGMDAPDGKKINLLREFYEQPKRRAAALQSFVLLTQIKMLAQQKRGVRVVERLAGSSAFLEIGRRCENLDEIEYAVLKEWYSTIHSDPRFGLRPHMIIYLQTDPWVAFARMQDRGRSEESGVSLEYVELLHEYHENWLVRREENAPDCHVVCINVNGDLASTAEKYRYAKEAMIHLAASHFEF